MCSLITCISHTQSCTYVCGRCRATGLPLRCTRVAHPVQALRTWPCMTERTFAISNPCVSLTQAIVPLDLRKLHFDDIRTSSPWLLSRLICAWSPRCIYQEHMHICRLARTCVGVQRPLMADPRSACARGSPLCHISAKPTAAAQWQPAVSGRWHILSGYIQVAVLHRYPRPVLGGNVTSGGYMHAQVGEGRGAAHRWVTA